MITNKGIAFFLLFIQTLGYIYLCLTRLFIYYSLYLPDTFYKKFQKYLLINKIIIHLLVNSN